MSEGFHSVHGEEECAILSTTTLLSLGTTSLFCALDRCDGPHGAGYIPLALPCVANEATPGSFCLGPAQMLEDATTDAIVTTLVASRSGKEPQIGGDGTHLPPGFAHNATRIMYGGNTVSREILTPLMKLFSSHRNWNNHRARSATLDDLDSLGLGLKVESHTAEASGVMNFLGSTTTSAIVTDRLSLIVAAMDKIVHQCPRDDPDFLLGGYERLFKTVTMACCPNVLFRDVITGCLENDLRILAPGPQREASYWLALNQFLPAITPVFLSPVHLPSRWLLAIMQHGSMMESGSFVGDIPILIQSAEAKHVRHFRVSTTIYQPNSSWENDQASDNGTEYTDDENQSEKQGSTENTSDGDDDEDEEHDDEDDCRAKTVKKRKTTDDALSESVRVLCQRSSVLMDMMQNFREPGIDVQRYVAVWCKTLSTSARVQKHLKQIIFGLNLTQGNRSPPNLP